MNTKTHLPVWNVLALFFLAWFATASWLLSGGDSSPIVRFAFAVCGSLGLFAGLKGGLFLFPVRGFCWLERKNLGCWSAVLCCLSFVAAVLVPVFLQANRTAHLALVSSELKQEGLRLLEYAEKHDGTLPPKMGRGTVYRYIPPVQRGVHPRTHFVWCGELGGVQLDDISHCDEVVVAYAAEPIGKRYPVLYLDGHVKFAGNRKELTELLRKRPALIEHAQHRRAKREAAATEH